MNAAEAMLESGKLTHEAASAHGLVVTEVDQSSHAAEAGLAQGDVIESVNRQPVNTIQQFNAAVRQGKSDSTLLLVRRGQGSAFLAIPK